MIYGAAAAAGPNVPLPPKMHQADNRTSAHGYGARSATNGVCFCYCCIIVNDGHLVLIFNGLVGPL